MSKPPMQFTVVNDFAGTQVRDFLAYLVATLGAGTSLPIREIFDRIPFGPMGGTTKEDLLARGSIRVRFGSGANEEGRLTNNGDEVFGEFNDEVLGDIAIVFPDRISASYRLSGDSIHIGFPTPVEVSVYILPTLSGDLRRSANQFLTSITATPDRWTYNMHTAGTPDECLALVVEFPLDSKATPEPENTHEKLILPKGLYSPRSAVRTVERARKRSLCPCCDGPTVVNLRTRWRDPIVIHFRRLVEPTLFSIDEYVQGVRAILRNSGITDLDIPVRAGSNEPIDVPELNILNVNRAGEGDSAEQARLFRNVGIPRGEYACYIVDQIISPDTPDILGRGYIPGNALVIVDDAPLATLVHELGHNFGMEHLAAGELPANGVMHATIDTSAPANVNYVFTSAEQRQHLRVRQS